MGHDGLAGLRAALRKIGDDRGHWAGIPMPLDGQRLVIEPRYPNAKALMKIGAAEPKAGVEPGDARVRNVFYSWRWKCDIVVGEEDGRIVWGKVPAVHHLDQDLSTLHASSAWGVEQEMTAMQTLETLVKPRVFRLYLLTGMFLERSKRSDVIYLFRRLKPTVAIRADANDQLRVLCCLCMHPIAYYAGSWAGAMCPTDDVISHLMLMRADETMLWRRANQHPAYRPEAGL